MRELRTRVSLILAVLLGVLLVVGACGDDDNGGGGGGGDAGDTGVSDTGGGGDTGVSDTGGGGDTGVSDTGGGDTGVADTEPADVPQEVGPGADPITSACAEYNQADVDWPAANTDGDPIRVIIEAVDFDESVFVVRNISGSEIVLTANWGLCHQDLDSSAACPSTLSNGYPLPAGQHVAIHIYREAGMDQPPNDDTNIWYWGLGDGLSADGGEVAIREQGSGVTLPDSLESYVRWGSDPSGPGSTTVRDDAAAAGVWQGNEDGDFVPTTAGARGIVATGDVSTAAGWTVASANCFP